MIVVASHDGEYFFTTSLRANKIVQRSISSNNVVQIFQKDDLRVISLAISEDCKYMVIGNVDGSVQLWDIQNATLLQTFSKKNCIFAKVYIVNDGKYIVTWWIGGEVEVRDLHTTKILQRIKKTNFSHLSRLFIAGNGCFIVEYIKETSIVIWDLFKGEKLYVLDDEKYMNINAITVSDHGDMLFYVLFDGTLEAFDLSKREISYTISLISPYTKRLYTTASGNYLMAANIHGVEIWDTVEKQYLYHKTGNMISGSFAFVNQSPYVIYSDSQNITLCNIQNDEKIWSINLVDLI